MNLRDELGRGKPGLLHACSSLIVATVAVVLVYGAPVHAATDPLVQEEQGAVVNWRKGVVSATAGAAPEHRMPSADVARPGAERRARAAARARIGQVLRQLPLGGGRHLDDQAITRALDRARVVDVDYQSNGGVVVTLEVPFGAWAPRTISESTPDGGAAQGPPGSSPPPSLDRPRLVLALGEGRLGAAPVIVVGGRELEPSGVRYSTGAAPSSGPRPVKARSDKKGRLTVDASVSPADVAGQPVLIYLQKVLR